MIDQAILARYRLPKGVDDSEMNRGQLAQAFGVSTNTIDKWRSDGMPVVQEGTNGQSYVYQLSQCWAWREARLADEKASKALGDHSAQQLRMHFLGLDNSVPRAHLSAAQRLAEAQAEMAWNKAAVDRRALMLVTDCEALLTDVFSDFRVGVQGLPDWAEREMALSVVQTSALIRYCDQLLVGTAERLAAAHLVEDEEPPLRGLTG